MINKRKKILMICTLPPPVHGSAMVSQYIKDSQLINDEFDMDFVNLSTSRSMGEIGKASPLLLIKKLWRFFTAYLKCFWMLLINRYALCYCAITCHGTGFLKDAPFVLLCKLFGRKIVIHQHNKGMSKDVDKLPYRYLLPLVYNNVKVILLSWRLYSDIEKIVRKEDVLVCPNGIPPLEGISFSDMIKKEEPEMLYLSNLITSKGVYVLLDACKILRERNIPFRCKFVGGESKEISRSVFERAVRIRGLENCVQYCGPKFGKEKDYYWKNADVFVFPTFYDNECFPLVLLEAMQHGLAIVTTDIGGIPDIINHQVSGLIVKAESTDDLADKLRILLCDNKQREILSKEANNCYQSNFTLSSFERKMCDCLNTVINGSN